tara:strand:- start:5021 stop:5206 length:186 start_codon:yes stop_codon:yes gene_type:complete
MDSEKKPIEKIAEEIKELVNDVGSLKNEISYIKVNLIQHIKSIDKKKEIKEKEITKGWLFF